MVLRRNRSPEKPAVSNIRMIRVRMLMWLGHMACFEEGRNGLKVLIRKPEGKSPIGKLNGRWNDNIVYWKNTVEGVVCIYLPKDRDQWWADMLCKL
jgi:hypothetical protein